MRNHFLRAAAGAIEPVTGWDITNLSFSGTPVNGYNTYDEIRFLRGLTIANSGTKAYIASAQKVGTGIGTDHITEYTLTSAWDISSAVYEYALNVNSYETGIADVAIKPDGTKIYCLGSGGDEVNEFDLSTAWDLSTATHSQAFSVSAQDTIPSGLTFKGDGTKMYVAGSGNDNVYQYDLSTAWDVSSASYVQAFSFAGQTASANAINFKSDGTKMFLSYSDDIWEYTLSSAWDISTASYSTNKLNYTRPISEFGYAFIKDDGTRIFWADSNKTCVFQTEFSTAWDVTSLQVQARPTTEFFSTVASGSTFPNGLYFKPDGTKMYVMDTVGDTVYEFDLSSAWVVATSTLNQTFSISGISEIPYSLFFKPDGTKFYVNGLTSDAVYQYDLSTAWDISTATYVQSYYIGGVQAIPRFLTFKPDGTKMYVSGATGDELDEFNLSVAWDISTASHFQAATQYYLEGSLNFKPDGTKLITTLYTSAGRSYLSEYTLSTPWDISTLGAPITTQDLFAQTSFARDTYIRDDGKKLFIADYNLDGIVAFDM